LEFNGRRFLATDSHLIFSIDGIQNAPTMTTTSSFVVETLASDQISIKQKKQSNLTVTNNLPGAIVSPTIIPMFDTFGSTVSYTLSFKTTSSIPKDGFFDIIFPTELKISADSVCLAILNLDNNLTCNLS
jgi:hypothetical protein